jgi:hypothetical protein
MSETKTLEELLSQWDRGRAEGPAISAEYRFLRWTDPVAEYGRWWQA